VIPLGLRRIWGVLYRHLALYRQSKIQFAELLYGPTMQMLVWGFTATYLTSRFTGSGSSSGVVAIGLVAGFLLWEVTLLAQLGMSNAFLEEVWSRNLVHLLVSPLRPAEFVTGLMGISLVRSALGIIPATLLAWGLYSYNVFAVGPVLILLVVNLLMMGWWLGLAVMILVLRYGTGVQGFAWSIVMSLAPLAAIFYPVGILPQALQKVAFVLPASHVFEALRDITQHQHVPWGQLGWAFLLNAAWIAAFCGLLARQFRLSREAGTLISTGD
jgi:ABC-2 type transport system permease protein